tara:strand:- start:6875 stop:8494 length:1620 start_codon:yes stop_codon:yes gene_type:complete
MAYDIDMSKSGPPEVVEETQQAPVSAADIPELRALVSQFKQERAAKRRREALARLGGFLEGMGGKDAYAVTQSRLPDYSDRYMTKQQKMQELDKLRKEREGIERYYFGKAQDRAKSKATVQKDNIDRETRRLLEIQKIRSGESKERARQARLSLSESVKQNNEDRKQLETPTDGTKSSMGTMPELDTRVKDNVDNYYAKHKKALREKYKGRSDREIKDELSSPTASVPNPNMYTWTREKAQQDAKNRITYLVQSGAEDKDVVYAMAEASRKSDTAENELYDMLDTNTQERARQADESHANDLDNITESNEVILGRTEATMRDPDTERPEARIEALTEDKYEPGLMYKRSQRIGSREAEKVGDVDPSIVEDMQLITAQDLLDKQLEERQAEAAAKVGETGEVEEEEPETGYLGIPGVTPPRNSGALAQLEKQQELIENYPDAPPVQYLRQQLSQSKEMQDYMKKNNITDFGIGLKEAIRDVRRKDRQDRIDSRMAVRKKRTQERLRDVPGLDKVGETPLRKKTASAVTGAETAADKDALT